MFKRILFFAMIMACAAVVKAAQPMNPASNVYVETYTFKGVSFDMVKVDGGSFMMGSYDGYSEELPVHSEKVSTFYIGKTEVTQALWQAVMGDNPSWFRGTNLPVETVSWNDCQEFVKRLSRLTGKNFRLPTEAEWEYAARGGNRSRAYTYSGSNTPGSVAWFEENSGKRTHPVATKLNNELGLYDMSGNVFEWTSDRWSDNYSSARKGLYMVIRGGCWDYEEYFIHSTIRNNALPDDRDSIIGLRLAL